MTKQVFDVFVCVGDAERKPLDCLQINGQRYTVVGYVIIIGILTNLNIFKFMRNLVLLLFDSITIKRFSFIKRPVL